MRKILFVLATVLLLTTVTVSSFADGDPIPHKSPVPQCTSIICTQPA